MNKLTPIKKLGIDLGNFSVKVAQENGDNFTFESRFEKYDPTYSVFQNEVVLTHDNEILLPEKGDFDCENIKVNRSNLKQCLASAIAQSNSIKNNDRVIIGVGLPLQQYDRFKNEFTNILLENNRIIKCSYGKYKQSLIKTVHIDDILVYPEGIGAYWGMANKSNFNTYWQMADQLKTQNPPMLIIADVGGRLTNVVTIVKEVNKGFSVCNAETKFIGTLSAYNLISKSFNSFAINNCIDCYFESEEIESLLYKNFKLPPIFNGLNKYESADLAFEKVSKQIARFIKESNPEYDKALIVLTGGGACRFGSKLQAYFPDNSVVDCDIYNNVNGYLAAISAD